MEPAATAGTATTPLSTDAPTYSGDLDKLREMVHGRFTKAKLAKVPFAARVAASRRKHTVKSKPRPSDPPPVVPKKRPASASSSPVDAVPTAGVDQACSGGWTVRTLFRHSGPNKGKEYYWHIAPDGTRYPSYKKATAAGFRP